MKIFNIIIICTLVGCASDNNNNTQPIQPASNVITSVDLNGCLVSSNADLTIDYLIADKYAKNLIWKCPDNKQSETQFYAYNYITQCYQKVQTYDRLSCYSGSKPTTPLFNVVIREFSGTIYPIGNGVVSFNPNAIAENNGNVDAFGVSWKIIREPGQEIASGTFDHINNSQLYPNFANAPFVPVNFTDIAIGQQVQFTFYLRSIYGTILDSQTITLQP